MPHIGLTTAGTIGARAALTLGQVIDKIMEMAEVTWKIRKDIFVICHGGPSDETENVGKALLKMPGIVGFYAVSSTERLPTERAIAGQTEVI